jgi:shikimate dehydrogenase
VPKLAVLGQPISHSRSPAMHTAALEEMGLGDSWSYEAIEVAPADFEARVRAMPAQGFVGANVTVPHKLAALALAGRASDAAAQIGAANTLSFDAGLIAADNTDATGIIAALPEPVDGKRALVLGAGGSARAAVWALTQAGAGVTIWNRTAAKAEALARALGARFVTLPTQPATHPLGDYDLVLNATSVGLQTASRSSGPPRSELGAGPDRARSDLKALHLAADGISARHLVVDLVYGTVETSLVAAARSRGASVVDGLQVLVHQGAASLRLWTGMEVPVETMSRAARGI